MLSIGKMTMGQDGYYATLAREDYYLKGGEPPGQWLGSGAEALRLYGQVDNERFKELFPEGSREWIWCRMREVTNGAPVGTALSQLRNPSP